MLAVKLEEFENYRVRLLEYATALLKSRGSAHTLYAEYDEKAKDIVQECYLAFHTSSLDCFVNELHLWNFLKLCLYRKYQESIDGRRKSTQYNLFKNGNLDYLDVNDDESTDNKVDNFKQPLDESNPTEEKDYINEFLKSLIPRQRELVIKLLDGFKAIELAKELNISRQAVSESIKYIKVKFNKYNESTTSKM